MNQQINLALAQLAEELGKSCQADCIRYVATFSSDRQQSAQLVEVAVLIDEIEKLGGDACEVRAQVISDAIRDAGPEINDASGN